MEELKGCPFLSFFHTPMRLLPLCYCPTLSEEDLYHHECSDRIWVPRHMFERWMTAEDVGSIVIVQLQGVPACMYAPHNGPRNVIYAPSWICEELRITPSTTEDDIGTEDEEDDYIYPERLQPAMCTFVKVQPHTSDHLPTRAGGVGGEEMPEDTLSRAFEEYTCIREGQTLMLHLPGGHRMFVTIVETQPVGKGIPLCIRNTEIAMDLLEPLDAPPAPTPPIEPTEPAPTLPVEPAPTVAPTVAPISQETREERRERMYRAAMARAAMSHGNG